MKRFKEFGIFDLMYGVLGGFEKWDKYENRLVNNTVSGLYTVDTVYCDDTEMYETAIWKEKGNPMIIVEEYETKEQAVAGHLKWVEFVKTEPTEALSCQTDRINKF